MDAIEYIQRAELRQAMNPDPFAPPIEPESARGTYVLGIIPNSGCAFSIEPGELVQHTVVTGSSGKGKTTLIRRIVKEIISKGNVGSSSPKLMIFDIKKDYSAIAAELPGIWQFRLPGDDFRWNPLEPPMMHWSRWAGIFSSTFANSAGFWGGQSTEGYLYTRLLQLYRKYDTERGIYPCMHDLLQYMKWLRAQKKIDSYSEEKNWYARIVNRLENVCESMGETLNCSRGYPMDWQLGHNMFFEMSELKPDAQNFFTENHITQAVHWRMSAGQRGGTLRNLVIFDEAKRFMPKVKEGQQQTICNMSNLVAMGREFGFGFLVADCDPRLLGDSIKANAYMRVCFNQSHGDDVIDSARSMGLKPEQAECIQCLETGEAIVRLAGRIDRPFFLRVME
jgi:hypothetical protein